MGTDRAQQALLAALLGRTPLPGGAEPLLFPDLPPTDEGRQVVLVSADPPGDLPTGLRVVPQVEAGSLEAGTAVLELLPAEDLPGRTGARLRVSRADDQGRLAPLGEVVATFVERADGELEVTEPTHVLAY